MKTVDIIVPCYNEEEVLETFYETTESVVSSMEGYQFTYILVDDGSRDSTLSRMKGLAAAHKNVRWLSFSRNFGRRPPCTRPFPLLGRSCDRDGRRSPASPRHDSRDDEGH